MFMNFNKNRLIKTIIRVNYINTKIIKTIKYNKLNKLNK